MAILLLGSYSRAYSLVEPAPAHAGFVGLDSSAPCAEDRRPEGLMKLRTLVAALVIFGVGLVVGRGMPSDRGARTPEAPPPPSSPPPSSVVAPAPSLGPLPEGLGADEKRDIDVFRRARVSVVFITNLAVRRGLLSFDVQQIPQGSGSGFIW